MDHPLVTRARCSGGLVIMLSSFLCLFLILIALILIKIFLTQWWTPTRLQKLMAWQGIKGPCYRLVHGNTKEILNMKNEAISRPKSLTHDLFPLVQPHYQSWVKKYGKVFLQWYGTEPQLVIFEPELCKEILNNKDRVYMQKDPQGFVKKLLRNGLGTAEGEHWSKLRKIANHAFHGESLKLSCYNMIASAEKMLQRWKNHEGKEIEVYQEFRLLTSDVISRTAFGSSYLEGKKIFDMLTKLSSLLFRNSYKLRLPGISKLFKTSDEIEADKVEKEIRNSILEIVKQREKKAVAEKEDDFGSDFIGLLLNAHHDVDDRSKISVDDVIDQCRAFYFAGQETTNGLLAWTVLLLALHPDWQGEARKEVLQIFGKQNPNPDGIAKLKTMSMIINESLRLYPPVIQFVRKPGREVRLGKFILPANIQLVIPNVAFHHDPQIWGPEAQLFKPERFSEGVAKATKDNMAAFLPFGMGPRICVGFNFATTETKIALSMILQRYTFTLSPGYVHSPLQFLTVRPQRGIQVMLHSL
ncbi:cytochrome P450 CYP749A22-like [Rosa rugosa]|uniref:cytochrome P450 CYP749A22-like n=1 Tax=Rosa rugosa TaxID=74645 RepID=UPI002B40A59E|nr:cytochrome P450 CYP749A22-like [Rosa rugosa]